MNRNMNLGSVQNLTEETWNFGTKPRQSYKLAGDCKPGGYPCNSNLTSQSFYPYSSTYPYMHTNYSSDWEIFEAVRIQELEEVKARAAQMEKTMRWWSDCTANWREKWSKVRAERNKAQEEARQLRLRLDGVVKEMSMLKKVNQALVNEKENLERITAWKTESIFTELPYITKDLNQLKFLEQEPVENVSKTSKIPVGEDTKKDAEVINDQNDHNKEFTPKPPNSFSGRVPSINLEEPTKKLENTVKTTEKGLIHVSVSHLHMAEMQKILQKEREMNVFLEKEMEKMENELFLWKWKYEELKQNKVEGVKQLERLQIENSSEWEKPERLVAEQQRLKEESRRLKLQVKEIQRLLEMKSKTKSSNDHQDTQSKLLVKNKTKETGESKLRIWHQARFLLCCWRFYQDSK
ncbi:coiled-coil domain-containing protein 102B [Calypte anna]|uniref:coiled-coil domain-containing protein 102B n=1 Tax=Calypte anna TaxID=9244 RepID=UPI0011C48796|nr:coiled-coil domain-containing protein 102B [Calypte anna]